MPITKTRSVKDDINTSAKMQIHERITKSLTVNMHSLINKMKRDITIAFAIFLDLTHESKSLAIIR